MPAPPSATVLSGRFVDLFPASVDDAAELFEALDDQRVWAAGYSGGPSARWADVAAVRVALAGAGRTTAGARQAYVVRLATGSDLGAAGAVVGTSSLGEWDLANERVHLGWTAYGPRWWGTVVNAECKLLLLGHAFEDCGFGRVKIQTDAINARSQAAIARLGATREGLLRRHIKRPDGTYRDTVVFSVLRNEWPGVREGLLARLP